VELKGIGGSVQVYTLAVKSWYGHHKIGLSRHLATGCNVRLMDGSQTPKSARSERTGNLIAIAVIALMAAALIYFGTRGSSTSTASVSETQVSRMCTVGGMAAGELVASLDANEKLRTAAEIAVDLGFNQCSTAVLNLMRAGQASDPPSPLADVSNRTECIFYTELGKWCWILFPLGSSNDP
jgi:hypothetical protein